MEIKLSEESAAAIMAAAVEQTTPEVNEKNLPEVGRISIDGQHIYIRTVTHHQVGRVVREDEKFIFLANSSWVADSGRWYQALKEGKLDEVEPMPGIVPVNKEAIIDAPTWSHPLPTKQQ